MYKQSQTTSDEQVLLGLVDSRLQGNFDREQVLRALKTALLCTLDSPETRLTTPQAISMLLGTEPIAETDLQPLVKLEYSKSLHALEFGVAPDEAWSESCELAPDEPPLLNNALSARH